MMCKKQVMQRLEAKEREVQDLSSELAQLEQDLTQLKKEKVGSACREKSCRSCSKSDIFWL